MLELRNVSKRYGGSLAVDNVSFRARPGDVTGYLGPNGSGNMHQSFRGAAGSALVVAVAVIVPIAALMFGQVRRGRSRIALGRHRAHELVIGLLLVVTGVLLVRL